MSVVPYDVERAICEMDAIRACGSHIGSNIGGAMELLLRSWVNAGGALARVAQPLI